MPRFRKTAGWHAPGLRRPELIASEMLRDRLRLRSDDEHSGNRDEHWSAVDIIAMVLAALQVVLPYVLVIIAAAAGAFGLFMLAFG